MRFTRTSSHCSPRGPSASITVHRSSFGALRGEGWEVNSGPGCNEVPGRPCSPPRGTTRRGRPPSGLPAWGAGRRAWERPLQPVGRIRARASGRGRLEAGEPGAEEPRSGLLPPGGSRDRPSRLSPIQRSGRSRTLRSEPHWAEAWGPDVPREAMRRCEHPGRRHQDPATQRLPVELQPH